MTTTSPSALEALRRGLEDPSTSRDEISRLAREARIWAADSGPEARGIRPWAEARGVRIWDSPDGRVWRLG